MNTFNFVGTLNSIKKTDSWSPVETKVYDSGWTNTTVKFNVISNETNRVLVVARGGKWKDDKKNVVKTMSKGGDGQKSEKIDISWSKRFDQEQIDKVAGYRKFVVDTDLKSVRYKLQDAVKAFEEGNITDELIAETGCKTKEAAEESLKKSNAKRHVFLAESDFAEFVIKVLASEKIKNMKFRVSGNQDISYNQQTGRSYHEYHVQRIERVADDEEDRAEMTIDFYGKTNCVDDTGVSDIGKGVINGWTTYWDGNAKKNGFVPVEIVIRNAKLASGVSKKFSAIDGEIGQASFVVDVIDGAPMKTITYDDLSDEDKEDVDLGLIDLKELINSFGGSIVGDKINELRFNRLNARKRNIEDTSYTVDDMCPAVVEFNEATVDEDDVDLFSDMDDDDLI